MKHAWKAALRVLRTGCICFTVLILLLLLLGGSITGFQNAVTFSDLAVVLLFSFLLAPAHLLLGVRRLKLFLRIMIHYAASLAAFCFVFIGIAAKLSGARSILTAIIFYTILYAVIMGFSLFMYFSVRKKDSSQKS